MLEEIKELFERQHANGTGKKYMIGHLRFLKTRHS